MKKKLIVIFSIGLSFIILLSITARVLSEVQDREVIYNYLEEALIAPQEKFSAVDWTDVEYTMARKFNDFDRLKLGKAITEAWSAFAASQDSGEVKILKDYFTAVALHRSGVAAKTSNEAGTNMVMLSKTATPLFYHLDGSIFQTKLNALTVRFAETQEALKLFHASYDYNITTLKNESLGWKVFSHERMASQPIKLSKAHAVHEKLVGINYYPAKTPWRKFWSNFDISIVEEDFNHIVDLGANSIRIFLPREDFLNKTSNKNLKNLNTLLDAALEKNILVIPTLFDLKGSYSLSTWSNDVIYLKHVMGVIAEHKAVVFTDIKNEPDLDFKTHGKGRIEAWVRSMALVIKQLAPKMPLTVGWSTAEYADVSTDWLDVITYHEYQPNKDTAARLLSVKEKAKNKPVMITEIGVSSFTAVAGWPSSHQEQASKLASRIAELHKADGIFIWTLHDFPNPDPEAVGYSPWVRNLQSQFGLIDVTGKLKPAAHAASKGFYIFMKGQN